MKKIALMTVLCLALTACTAGFGAEPVIEDVPLNTTGIDAVTQAIETYDAENAVPYIEHGYYFDDYGKFQVWYDEDDDAPPADRPQPGDAEMTLQEAANLAESYRKRLGWPEVPEDGTWELCYLPEDPEFLAAFFAWDEEWFEVRSFFVGRYSAPSEDGVWSEIYWITMDSVTGAVLSLESSRVPPFYYRASFLSPEEYSAEAAAWNESIEKASENMEAIAEDAKAVLARIGVEAEWLRRSVHAELMEKIPTEWAAYEEAVEQEGSAMLLDFRQSFYGELRGGRLIQVEYDVVSGVLLEFRIENMFSRLEW